MRAPGSRKAAGRALVLLASLGFLLVLLIQVLHTTATITAGFSDWRPILIAYLVWAVAVGVGQVLTRGERGQRALFLLPAVFFTVAVVIFPTIFGIYIASLDWNLSSIEGPRFSGFDNLKEMLNDTYYWNALGNMVFYTPSRCSANTRSRSDWRSCSAPRSARENFSAWSSCCQ